MDPGWIKIRIRDKHPGSATLITGLMGSHVSCRDLLLANKVKAPAKAGALAPLDVTVPAQNTGMGPEKTSFFQALSIPTKITKGTIEIISDVPLIKAGDRVSFGQ